MQQPQDPEENMKMMRKLWTAIAGSFVMLLVMMPSLALAAKKLSLIHISEPTRPY